MKPNPKWLAFATLTAIVCIGSPFLPPFLATVASATIILLIGSFFFRAIFATGAKRIFAVGFLLPSVIYISTAAFVGDFTFKHLGHRLPTTELLQSFVQPPISDPPVIQLVGPEANLRAAHGRSFIPLGHLLVAVALGGLGGIYATQLRTDQVAKPTV